MLVLVTFLLALLVSNGAAWLALGSSNDKLDRVNAVYSNQVVPVYEAYRSLQRARLDQDAAAIELQEGRVREAGQYLNRARASRETANQAMAAFAKVEKSGEMAEKAASVQSLYERYANQASRLADSLGSQNVRQFIDLNVGTQAMAASFDTAVSAYLDYVDAGTDQLVVDAAADYKVSQSVSIALLVISLVLAGLCWLFMQRSVLRPLREAGQHFDKIAAGDLTARVEVRNSNEIGQLFSALKRMQENLARTVAQVRRG
ncbi:HAMP domain-containing protein, partial [Bordetella petrii]